MGKNAKEHRKKVAKRNQRVKESQNYISRVWNEEFNKAMEQAKEKQQEGSTDLNLSAEQ